MRAAAYKMRFCKLSNLPRRTGQLCGGFLFGGDSSDYNRHHWRCNILLQGSRSEGKPCTHLNPPSAPEPQARVAHAFSVAGT
jgi:hypothetical protein